MDRNNIINLLQACGFEQAENRWQKRYHGNHEIIVDCDKESIEYQAAGIVCEDLTTSNFSQAENFVVLECVNRLLDKGYHPSDLTLEKKWPLGRTGKSGKADIVVRGRNSEKTLMIIECKTWGNAFEKEKTHMQNEGGQLFSYFQQDKSSGFLVLYTSQLTLSLTDKEVDYKNAIVPVSDSPKQRREQAESPDSLLIYEKATTVLQSLEVWKNRSKKGFIEHGIFEDKCEPYNPGFIPLRINQLKEFTGADKGRLHGEFMEILRHNNISDRSNAFNRFISLVLAKMMDESRGQEEEAVAEFQFKQGIDDAESLYERLQALYVNAMQSYLKEDLVNHTLEEIRCKIENFPIQMTQEDLYRIYRELKLYTNNEFAFKEVYNATLFEENARVLEEIVSLFQPYKFRYDEKCQFLGDFFELMLENGYKQTEGQFFTPTPIARFIVSSLPIERIIRRNLKSIGNAPLPRIIDYACGSGHFLTESIEALQTIIKEKFPDTEELNRLRGNTLWARDYIWGVERDYRLARTSQVACFMHGDGDANIIYGDGLEKHPQRELPENNFNVLVSNPPYSIKGFKQHLRAKPKDFTLWNEVSNASDDIEVFFVERIGQLLKKGGVAGVILPSSILDNDRYDGARTILLQRFLIRAIVDLGENVFAATKTNTVILFLQKRNDNFAKDCRYIANDFIINNDRRPNDFIDSQKLYADFLRHRNLSNTLPRSSHWNLLQTKKNKALLADYHKKHVRQKSKETSKEDFRNKVLETETEKFYCFLLTHQQVIKATENGKEKQWKKQCVLVVKNNGNAKSQKQFLGYEFSERRGFEGLRPIGKGLLCDESTDASDCDKINYYIVRSFSGEYPPPSDAIKAYCETMDLCNTLNFDGVKFTKSININAAAKTELEPSSRWKTVQLGDYINFSPKSKRQAGTGKEKGKYPFFTSSPTQDKYIDIADHNTRSVIIGDGGRSSLHIASHFSVSDHNFVITPKDGLNIDYLYHYLAANFDVLTSGLKGIALQNISKKHVNNIKLPLPPIDVQKKIVTECAAIDNNATAAQQKIVKIEGNINTAVMTIDGDSVKIADYADLIRGVTYDRKDQSLAKTNNIILTADNINLDGVLDIKKEIYLRDNFSIKEEQKLRAGDIFICMSSGSRRHVGKVAYINENMDFYAGGFMGIIREREGILGKYLFLILNHPQKRQEIQNMSRGSNIKNLNKLLDLEISLPSIKKQEKLIAKITPEIERITELRRQISAAAQNKAMVLKKHL